MAQTSQCTVTWATFKAWNVGEVFGCETETLDSGKMVIAKVWCKTCARHADKIQKDFRLKGKARSETEKYISGTSFVSKHTVFRHLSSKAHSIGTEYETLLQGNNSIDISNNDDDVPSTSAQPRQPKIDSVLHKQAEEAYRKLFRTVYFMATDGLPLSTFKTFVNVQKANGVKLLSGTDSSDRANEFVQFLADSIREKLCNILTSASVFSLLTDGSQARKTGSEKELVMVRVANSCSGPAYFCIALQNIDEFGDASAENLKRSIDAIFEEKVVISREVYSKSLVSVTSDGASVNTGVYNGLLTRMSNDDRPWLVKIHCVSHRVELSIKDSIMKEKGFKNIHEFMTTLYYLFKRSGKFKRHFKETGAALGVVVYVFPKVHGTRFINHHRKGIDILIHNWPVLASAIENSIANNLQGSLNPKLSGILKKLKDFSFLCTCMLYKSLLDCVAPLSLKFEQGKLLAFEIKPSVNLTKDHLNDLLNEEIILSGGFDLELGDTNILKTDRPKAGHTRKKPVNREFVSISMSGITNCNDLGMHKVRIQNIKQSVIPTLVSSLDKRFESFENPVFVHSIWLDPANWRDDVTSEVESLQSLASFFPSSLEFRGFSSSNLKREWKDLKLTVTNYYHDVGCLQLWPLLFKYRRKHFPNICLLAEVALCLGVSNSVVECGFSHLTGMLSDRRLSMKHETMENLLLIKVNNAVWSPKERDEILESSLRNYMSKRRKLKLDDSCQFNTLGVTGSTKRTHPDDPISETLSEFECCSDDSDDHELSDNDSDSDCHSLSE